MSQLYLGLMSGTSMDGVDVALVDFSTPHPHLLDCQTFPYPAVLLEELHQLCTPGSNEIVRMGHADRAVAQLFADAALTVLKDNYIRADQVIAMGSHGQTIRHLPEGPHGFSLQIGDPNTLAALTEIDVVADFRRKDIALGGQGAPLVPAFHHSVFSNKQSRVVVNIGGISNITYLPQKDSTEVIGYDTGPGNTLMDLWCKKHTGKHYDAKGAWAAQRSFSPTLLNTLCLHPYFSLPAPKSTGRELFNMSWLQQQLLQHPEINDPQVIQATLAMFTSRTIANEICKFPDVEQVYVCGGGAKNEFLMECLESHLHECEVFTTDELGVDPDAVEAMAFAWLAYAHVNRIEGSLASVTGAKCNAILGSFCPGKR
ncbi:anhydro-N-acetylmuramic acid kinase [Paraglaciecola hydrolytica]|uniref:Anhydro-N-acetylmuramic acid kinase n=1 Tax=Paraglaciecola hydrolytica TaxID=1799789 RepID=A0A136A209_9ALTE|nr:anhydro-N-acetylmuramic acid kinase [Paraglaciecola hydrolytica]